MTWRSRPRYDHGKAATRSGGDTASSACARGLARGECRYTKFCIVTGVRAWLLGVV